MATYTLQLGGLSESQHIVEQLDLPTLPHLRVVVDCRRALDLCSASRKGVTVIGPKGAGKTVGVNLACQWFAERERELRRRDEGYVVKKILRFAEIRCKSDREVALLLARDLDPRYSERANGMKKSVAQIRGEIVASLHKGQYAVVVVDEAESFSGDALQFLRDLLRDSRDAYALSARANTPGGIGLLLIGDDTFEPRTRLGTEAGHRWSQLIEVPTLTPAEVHAVYSVWFPSFHDYIQTVGENAWGSYLASVVGRGRPVTLRFMENQARLYAHYMVRSDPSIIDQAEIRFNRHFFDLAAEESAWADTKPQAPKATKPISARARAGRKTS